LRIVARFRLDSVYLAVRRQLLGRKGASCDQATTSNAYEEVIELSLDFLVLEQLQACRALPSDHMRMVIRWYYGRILILLLQFGSYGLTIFSVSIIEDHVATIALGGLEFERGRILWHDDGGLYAKELAR